MCLGPGLKLLWETIVLLADSLVKRHQACVTVLSLIHLLKCHRLPGTHTAGESTEFLFILLMSNISLAFSQDSINFFNFRIARS